MSPKVQSLAALAAVLALMIGSPVEAARKPRSKNRSHSLRPAHPAQVWSHKLPGFVTDLGIARDASAVFFATIPDFEREDGTGQKDYRVSRIGRSGKVLWSRKTEGQVKSLSLSDDGLLGVYADYNDQLTALDPQGRVVWRVHGACRPVLLTPLKRVICYHDDDAEPKVAFELLDWKTGARLSAYSIQTDVLALKASADERSFALALTLPEHKGSKVVVFSGPEAKPVSEFQINSEVIDLAVSSGGKPKVAVLASAAEGQQKIITHDGSQMRVLLSARRAEQMEIGPSGAPVLVYGNGVQGQQVVAYGAGGPEEELRELWSKTQGRSSDYSASVLVADGEVIAGLEVLSGKTRESRYACYSYGGEMKWQLPVTLEEGSYLYTQAYSASAQKLVVATDDARLSMYDVSALQGDRP